MHDGPGAGLLDGDLERGQVDFAQRALGHVGRAGHAAGLLVVGREMLGRSAHALALHAVDKGGGQFARKGRVLGIIFKVAAAQRAALDVERRAQHDAEADGLSLGADGLAKAAQQIDVKARGRRAPGREADRLDAVVDALAFLLRAQAVGAVRYHHGRDAQAADGLGVPEVRAGAKAGFLLQRHLGDQFGNMDRHEMLLLQFFCSGRAPACIFDHYTPWRGGLDRYFVKIYNKNCIFPHFRTPGAGIFVLARRTGGPGAGTKPQKNLVKPPQTC